MNPGQPSRTALAAASYRAAHQLLEGGRIFADPLAAPILGVPAADTKHLVVLTAARLGKARLIDNIPVDP